MTLKQNSSLPPLLIMKNVYQKLTIGNSCIKPSQTIRKLGAYFDSNDYGFTYYYCQSDYHLPSQKQFTHSQIYRQGHLSSCCALPHCFSPTLSVYSVYKIGLQDLFLLWIDGTSLRLSYNLFIGYLLNRDIAFKLLVFVYKSLNGLEPMYISDCLKLYVPNRHLTSSKDHLRLEYPITRVQAGDKTFTVCASKIWNNLPRRIRQSVSVNAFKKALKTFLFPN